MRRFLFLAVTLCFAAMAVVGCRAEGEIDTRHQSVLVR